MTTNTTERLIFTAANTAIAAAELQDGLLAVITGVGFEERYFDKDILGRYPNIFRVQIGGEEYPLHAGNLRFDVGSAIGKLSGISPVIEVDSSDVYREVKLGLNDDGTPDFNVVASVGARAVTHFSAAVNFDF